MWVDAAAFERSLREGRLDDALALVRGPVLDGLADDWVYAERDRQDDRVRDALARAADEAEARGDLARGDRAHARAGRASTGWPRTRTAP